jgi:YrbI family 3-deoxy-D-manno-octulosonate 8-phosphate phosphatase
MLNRYLPLALRPTLRAKLLVITHCLIDCDGVLTNGCMKYTPGGDSKDFHTYDSTGILMLKRMNISSIIVTSDQTGICAARARHLGVKCINDVDKYSALLSSGVNLSEAAHIGDEANDLFIFDSCLLSVSPSSAPKDIRQKSDLVLKTPGGTGVVREFALLVAQAHGLTTTQLHQLLGSAIEPRTS